MLVPRALQDREVPEYFRRYTSLLEEKNVLQAMEDALQAMIRFFTEIPDEKWNYAYAPGKWTLKESVIHLIDTERIMAYRALRIARNDKTPLMGFEQDDYIPFYNAVRRSPASIVDEYGCVRKASISLFQNLENEAFDRMGTASGVSVSVLALAHIIVGHERHHLNIWKDKYLSP